VYPLKLGVAFSGGGVRSAAQLGIMQYLYEQEIKPTIFAGTSGGSIVATLLALGYEPKEALELFRKVDNIKDIAYWHILSRLFSRKPIEGLFKGDRLRRVLEDIFGDKWASHQLAVVTTDINSGTQVIFTNSFKFDRSKINDDNFQRKYRREYSLGRNLPSVVASSCSIPALFIPREFGDLLLVDGGITNNLPSDVVWAMGADKVVSIDLGYSGKRGNISGIHEILSQSLHVLMEREVDNNSKDFGIYLNPEVFDVGMLQMTAIDYCYWKGYRYAKDNYWAVHKYLKDDASVQRS
jgi:NTE family protein